MFMRVFSLLFVCLVGTASLAQTNLRAEFDAKALSAPEKRLLQTALAFENHYNSLLDGAWGRGSQSALVRMVDKRHDQKSIRWSHVSQLAKRWDDERVAREWRPINSQGVSFQAPMKIMQPDRARRGEALVSNPKGLQIRIMPQTISQALTLANAVTARHAGRGKPYQSLSDNRLIVSAEMDGGGGIYMRTNEIKGNLITTLVEWTPEHANKARVMIASIQKGEQAMITLPRKGTLVAMLAPAPKPVLKPKSSTDFTFDNDAAAPIDTAFRPISRGKGRLTGNAVFINNTDLVTSASAVARCKAVGLQGLGNARVVAVDAKRDLAVIMSQTRSEAWIDVPRATPERGQNVVVLGYNRSNGNARDLRAFRVAVRQQLTGQGVNGTARLTDSAPNAQHGSVVLDSERRLAGLVIRAPAGSSERQRNSFIAGTELLRGFLRDNNVMFSRGTRSGARTVSEDDMRQTMWQVLCER